MRGGKFRQWRLAAIALALLLLAFVIWNVITGWTPSRDEFSVQGVVVDEDNGKPFWPSLGATGVDFAYLTATRGAERRDKQFAS
ncbi:MAG: glycoside hydrolase family 25, partial [Sphingorhabdus sp.]